MLQLIFRMLERCGTDDAVLPPTELYNEGWMLRLVLDWFSRNRQTNHALTFSPGARWYSEALFASRFLPTERGDPRAESFTHADGIVGHFEITPGERGEARLSADAKQFLVVEAKLGSALSVGTKNASTYDQAARNVACIAHLISEACLEVSALEKVGFYVIAPSAQIEAGIFADLVTKESIERKVRDRVVPYGGTHDAWLNATLMPLLDRISLGLLSWEEVIEAIPPGVEKDRIQAFYTECLRWNPLRGKRAV